MIRSLAPIALAAALVTANAAAAQTVLKLEPYRRSVAARVEIGGQTRLMAFDTGGGDSII